MLKFRFEAKAFFPPAQVFCWGTLKKSPLFSAWLFLDTSRTNSSQHFSDPGEQKLAKETKKSLQGFQKEQKQN
jgi:hypothetical protein